MAECNCDCNKLNAKQFTKKSEEFNRQGEEELYKCIKRNFEKQINNYDYHLNNIVVELDCKDLIKFARQSTYDRFNKDGWNLDIGWKIATLRPKTKINNGKVES